MKIILNAIQTQYTGQTSELHSLYIYFTWHTISTDRANFGEWRRRRAPLSLATLIPITYVRDWSGTLASNVCLCFCVYTLATFVAAASAAAQCTQIPKSWREKTQSVHNSINPELVPQQLNRQIYTHKKRRSTRQHIEQKHTQLALTKCWKRDRRVGSQHVVDFASIFAASVGFCSVVLPLFFWSWHSICSYHECNVMYDPIRWDYIRSNCVVCNLLGHWSNRPIWHSIRWLHFCKIVIRTQ